MTSIVSPCLVVFTVLLLSAKISDGPCPVIQGASSIGSAKLNGIDAMTYLRFVLERIADHPINRIDELLPWNVAAALVAPKEQLAA